MLKTKLKAFSFIVPFSLTLFNCKQHTFILQSKVHSVSNPLFGNIDFEISCQDFINAGFDYDDLINVTIKNYDNQQNDITFSTAFVKNFNETGYFAPCLCNYEGKNENFELNFATHPLKNTSTTLVGKDVEFKMVKKEGYKKTHELISLPPRLTWEQSGGDNYAFANFRDIVSVGTIAIEGIESNLVYRGSSPFNFKDNPDGRIVFADYLMNLHNIDNEISLSVSDKTIEQYMNQIDKQSYTYQKWIYSKEKPVEEKTFFAVELGTDYFNCDVEHKDGNAVKDVFDYIAIKVSDSSNHHPKFYFHCNEGKDRTAFIIMVLEALTGVSLDNIVEDYMLTFKNYYDVTISEDKEKYDKLAEIGIYRFLYSILIDNPKEELSNIDWYTFNAKEKVEAIVNADSNALINGANNYLNKIIQVSADKINDIIQWMRTLY